MDPLSSTMNAVTAIANTVTAITNATVKAVEGMTVEQRKIHWDQHQQAIAVWQALLQPLTNLILAAAAKQAPQK